MKNAFGITRKTLRSDVALAAVVGLGAAVAFAGGQAQAFPPENLPCPTSRLAPSGLDPVPAHCATANCLVAFKGYQWWTAYQYPFYNGGLKSIFAPEHAFIGGDGNLHLMANNDVDLGAGNIWSGGDAVLMFHGDGSEANLGYGDYLVTARLVHGHWATLDPNVVLGLFTYERPATGPNPNRAREIDLAEISRWGWDHINPPTCPIGGINHHFDKSIVCKGDAQFTLQEIGLADAKQAPLMVDRYDIGNNDEVTLVMRWHHGTEGKEVTFEKYSGAHSLKNLPPAPDYAWKTDPDKTPTHFKTMVPPEVKSFIPDHTPTSCERFHVNFWFGNYTAGAGKPSNPPPSSPQEVIITNFEFRSSR